jgi:hypothetical protein
VVVEWGTPAGTAAAGERFDLVTMVASLHHQKLEETQCG